MKYADKLKDPRWQKVRLEIMSRDEWACVACKRKDRTLNVHHTYYKMGKEPWEYDEKSLVTLCEECHSFEHDYRKHLEGCILHCFERNGLLADDIDRLEAVIEVLGSSVCVRESIHAVGWHLTRKGVIKEIVSSYRAMRKRVKK